MTITKTIATAITTTVTMTMTITITKVTLKIYIVPLSLNKSQVHCTSQEIKLILKGTNL